MKGSLIHSPLLEFLGALRQIVAPMSDSAVSRSVEMDLVGLDQLAQTTAVEKYEARMMEMFF